MKIIFIFSNDTVDVTFAYHTGIFIQEWLNMGTITIDDISYDVIHYNIINNIHYVVLIPTVKLPDYQFDDEHNDYTCLITNDKLFEAATAILKEQYSMANSRGNFIDFIIDMTTDVDYYYRKLCVD